MIGQLNSLTRVAVIGASRGFGAAILEEISKREPQSQRLGVARRQGLPIAEWVLADVSAEEGQTRVLSALEAFRPTLLVCSLGGGPFGLFGQKSWESQEWAFQVTLIFPARLIHWALQESNGVQQMAVIGSSVAENKADPRAAAYSSAKHGLKGLWQTVVAENPRVDVRLYSPGYMDTALLPPNAPVRQQPIWAPSQVAKDFCDWLADGPRHDHRSLAVFAPHR